jgi:hypothetical protein
MSGLFCGINEIGLVYFWFPVLVRQLVFLLDSSGVLMHAIFLVLVIPKLLVTLAIWTNRLKWVSIT